MNKIFENEGIPLERSFNEILAEVQSKRQPIESYGDDTPFNAIQKAPDSNQRGFSLYKIAETLAQCNAIAAMQGEENEGVIEDDLANQLDSLEMAKELKVLNICKVIKNMKHKIDGFKAAIEQMQKRMKSVQNDSERLLNYLTLNLVEGETFEDAETVLSWKKETGTEVFDMELLPDSYCKFEGTIIYDQEEENILEFIELLKTYSQKKKVLVTMKRVPMVSDKINPDLKANIEVPGARKKTGKYIVIK